jgi:hypothetical protein
VKQVIRNNQCAGRLVPVCTNCVAYPEDGGTASHLTDGRHGNGQQICIQSKNTGRQLICDHRLQLECEHTGHTGSVHNVSDVCTGGARFDSRLGHRLS